MYKILNILYCALNQIIVMDNLFNDKKFFLFQNADWFNLVKIFIEKKNAIIYLLNSAN